MTARKTRQPLNTRLGELEQAVAAARAREREVEREREIAKAEVARITEGLVEAFARGDEVAAGRLASERADAEWAVAAERLEGARRATQRAEVELSTFARENLEGLLRERVPQANAAAHAVTDALEALHAAHAEWTSVEVASMALLRLAGQRTDSQPRFPPALAALVRDARRVDAGNVPLPLPVAPQPAARLVRAPAESQSRT
jgi:hypothetical protein